jgi:lipoyl-dependent peroxiredoxin
MPTRRATATWDGPIMKGKGRFDGESGAIGAGYSFGARFGDEKGTNPEELLAAAEAACFSMALSGNLERAGVTPTKISTSAACTVEKQGAGFKITTMVLDVTVDAPGLDAAKLGEVAQQTKQTCPVSQALAGVEISVNARLA